MIWKIKKNEKRYKTVPFIHEKKRKRKENDDRTKNKKTKTKNVIKNEKEAEQKLQNGFHHRNSKNKTRRWIIKTRIRIRRIMEVLCGH